MHPWIPAFCFQLNNVGLLQQILHGAGSLGEVHLTRIFFLEHGHHLAHVAQPLRAGFRNRVGDRLLNPAGVDGGRQVRFEDDDLGAEATYSGPVAIKTNPTGTATTKFGVAGQLADTASATAYGAFYRLTGRDIDATMASYRLA